MRKSGYARFSVTKNENFRRKKWMFGAPKKHRPSIFSVENFHFSSHAHFLSLFGQTTKVANLNPIFNYFCSIFINFLLLVNFLLKIYFIFYWFSYFSVAFCLYKMISFHDYNSQRPGFKIEILL